MEAAKAEKVLDLRGVRCPQEVLQAKTAPRDVPGGEALEHESIDFGGDGAGTALREPDRSPDRQGHEQRGDLYIFRIIEAQSEDTFAIPLSHTATGRLAPYVNRTSTSNPC